MQRAAVLAMAFVVLAGALPHAQDAAPAAPAAGQAAPAAAAPAGNAQNGQKLFLTYYCYSCHGSDGQGGAGAKLAPSPPAFNYFRGYVRKPTGGMPPYRSNVVPDTDLADIYAYLKTIPPGQPAKNIPMLALQ